jgi:hypothetical protein
MGQDEHRSLKPQEGTETGEGALPIKTAKHHTSKLQRKLASNKLHKLFNPRNSAPEGAYAG